MKKKNYLKVYLIMVITMLGLSGCNSNAHIDNESAEDDEIVQTKINIEEQKQELQEGDNEKVVESYEDIFCKYRKALSEQWNMGNLY